MSLTPHQASLKRKLLFLRQQRAVHAYMKMLYPKLSVSFGAFYQDLLLYGTAQVHVSYSGPDEMVICERISPCSN